MTGGRGEFESAPPAYWASVLAIFIVSLIPIFSVPVLPVIDFYNHLARYYVLSNIDNSDFLIKYYQSSWSMLPNIGMDVIGTVVLTYVSPLGAAKVISIIILASQYFGVIFFNRSLTGKYSIILPILLVPFMYSYIFIWGFANFLLGLGLAFFAAGWWLRRRRQLGIALPVACVFAVVIFLVHGLAFALYGLLVGGLEIGLFLTSKVRDPKRTALMLAALASQAVAPFLMFMATTTAKADGGITSADESMRRLMGAGDAQERLLELALYRLQTIVRVAEGPTLWFDVATFVLTLAALCVLAMRGSVRVSRVAWPSIALGCLLVALVPPAMFGVGYVADRMPLYLAFLVIGSLEVNLGRATVERVVLGLLVGLSAVRIAYIIVDWQRYRVDFAEFQSVAKLIPDATLVNQVLVGRPKHVSAGPRCEMYGPLLVALHGQASPLFANATQQPLKLVGPLRRAVDELPSPAGLADGDAPAFYDRYIAQANADGLFRYLLICQADRLTQAFPAGSKVVARTERFTLLALRPPSGEE